MHKEECRVPSFTTTMILLIPFIMILIGLAFTVITDTYIVKSQKQLMLAVLILTIILVIQNTADFFLGFDESKVMLHRIFAVLGYTIRPAIIVLFFDIVNSGKRNIFAWALVVINALIYISDLLIPNTYYTFTYLQGNIFVRGPLGYTCHVISGILIALLVVMIVKIFRDDKRLMVLPFANTLLIIIALIADAKLRAMEKIPISALTMAIIISCVFYFFWIHSQLVRQHEEDLKAEQRMKIMVSQIQPHFLYNTIATIRALCKKNPDSAALVAEKFGQYLRQNIDSLSNAELITVEKELKHTKVYTDIEMVRFENISVEFDIEDVDFSLPALTIQPIVENAIRHGVRIRDEGVVHVHTYSADGYHIISVEDNGIGFDTTKEYGGDGNHIGLENVRERIEKMCGGDVTIESEINKGTTVTIRIPQTESKNDNNMR